MQSRTLVLTARTGGPWAPRLRHEVDTPEAKYDVAAAWVADIAPGAELLPGGRQPRAGWLVFEAIDQTAGRGFRVYVCEV